MFGAQLSRGRGAQDLDFGYAGDRENLLNLGLTECERAGLVEDDGVHAAQRLQVQPALDDGAEAGGAADAAQWLKQKNSVSTSK
jgi:hypothetical protein